MDDEGNLGTITIDAWEAFGWVCTVMWDNPSVSNRIDGTSVVRVARLSPA